MAVELVRGDVGQLEEIVKLNSVIFAGLYDTGTYPLEYYQKKITDFPDNLIYLIKEGDKLVGDMIAYATEDSWHIWALGMEEEYQRRGVGTELLEMNEKIAGNKGFNAVTVNVYNTSPEMQRLLLKRGYQIIGIDASEIDSKYNEIHFKLEL